MGPRSPGWFGEAVPGVEGSLPARVPGAFGGAPEVCSGIRGLGKYRRPKTDFVEGFGKIPSFCP